MNITIRNADTIHEIDPAGPFAIIQIANIPKAWEEITLHPNCRGVLRLDFMGSHDFTTDLAQRVLRFVEAVQPIDIIVQCVAGEMRSPAIAAAVLEIFQGRGKGNVIWRDRRYRPMRGVYDRLMAEARMR